MTIGIVWFNENDWEEWKKISVDKIEDNYEEWLIEASLSKSKFEEEGYNVKQVNITPNNFKNWCKKNHEKLDSSARSNMFQNYYKKVILKKGITSASTRQRIRIQHFYSFRVSRSVSTNLFGFVLLNKIF